jgi:tRNA(Ile)-lysidine synthetase-like protein
MEDIRIPRKAYANLPSLLRIRILQILCFERIGKAPNERLLASMDKLIVSGGASARLNVGRGATLRCRYGEAILSHPEPRGKPRARDSRSGRKGKRKEELDPSGKGTGRKITKTTTVKEPLVRMEGPGMYRLETKEPEDGGDVSGFPRAFRWTEQERIAPERMRRLSGGGKWTAFDADVVSVPLEVRPLRVGDRIRPFGLDSEKKVKEILIDRKVPREERWGRAVVCDADGKILWIPGVLRSAHAPVTPKTRRTVVLRAEFP